MTYDTNFYRRLRNGGVGHEAALLLANEDPAKNPIGKHALLAGSYFNSSAERISTAPQIDRTNQDTDGYWVWDAGFGGDNNSFTWFRDPDSPEYLQVDFKRAGVYRVYWKLTIGSTADIPINQYPSLTFTLGNETHYLSTGGDVPITPGSTWNDDQTVIVGADAGDRATLDPTGDLYSLMTGGITVSYKIRPLLTNF